MKNYYKFVVETNNGKKYDSFENSRYHHLFTSLRECKNDAYEYTCGLEYETSKGKKLKVVRYFKVKPESKEVK